MAAYMEHRQQWPAHQPQQQQQHLMMQMTPATHQLIHGGPPGTHQLIQVAHRDEADEGYRTNSSSSSCSDGHSPHSQMVSESPPPGKKKSANVALAKKNVRTRLKLDI